MATNTYVALDKVTLSSTAATATFSAIPATYTDLVVVANFLCSTDSNISAYVNGVNTGTSYSNTHLTGSGSAAASSRGSNQTTWQLSPGPMASSTTSPEPMIINIQNYSNTTTYKTALFRYGINGATYNGVAATVGLYRDTAAITSFTLKTDQLFSVGSTFSLYGIASAEASAKATGGMITSDDTYWYHTFLTSGTFTPKQSLTCDYLVVAGGGGGGAKNHAGGGAGGGGGGGLRSTVTATGGGGSLESALSLTATGYTVTIGGGGAGTTSHSTAASSGTNSVFSTITATGGGRGGNQVTPKTGATGGSGGGSGIDGGDAAQSGGSGTANQGYSAGTASTGYPYRGSGGGGAGAASATSSSSQNGGVGVAVAISGTSTYYAGGGGGAGDGTYGAGGNGGGGAGAPNSSTNNGAGAGNGVSGTANTGGGGGGTGNGYSASNGGSGIVIVRYAK